MNVKIIDIKSGSVKTMPERYAKILVKARRARWPDSEVKQYIATAVAVDDQVSPEVVAEPVLESASDVTAEPKRRGRKPKAQVEE